MIHHHKLTMKASSLFSFIGVSLQAVAALPQAVPRATTCTSPKLRKEWSQATRAEQDSYIQAALCLATKPSRLGLQTTLYDDFGWVHAKLFSLSENWFHPSIFFRFPR